MNRCPSCDFPVDSEWRSCRRCGARLVVSIERVAMPPAPSRRTAPRVSARAPVSDTLLPGAPAVAAPRPTGPDPMLPPPAPARAHVAARRGVAAAGVVAFGVALGRAVRRHRR